MTAPIDLAPLLARLKSTAAPTVEDAKRWEFWTIRGGEYQRGAVRVSVEWSIIDAAETWMHMRHSTSHAQTLVTVRCVDMADTEWRPVPTPDELVALAALPQKVVVESMKAVILKALTMPDDSSAADLCEKLPGIDRDAIIVAACLKGTP